MHMDIETFWNTIERSRAGSDGTTSSQADELAAILRKRPATEIAEFHRHFAEANQSLYTWDLWGAAHVLLGGCSDDTFTDFRSWIVAQGHEYVSACAADPAALGDGRLQDEEDLGGAEELSYPPSEVYEELTGNDLYDDYPSTSMVGEEPSGEPWDEDDEEALQARFPNLQPIDS